MRRLKQYLKQFSLLSVLFLFLLSNLNGMDNPLSLKLKIGRVPTNYSYEEFPKYVISPELEIESKILNTEDDIFLLSGSFYLFIWDDFIDEPIEGSTDNSTWSTTCIGTGIRPKLNIDWISNLNIQLFTGISYFYYHRDYIGGGLEISDNSDIYDRLWFYELGGNVNYKIFKKIKLILEYSYYRSVKEHRGNQKHIKIGVQYLLD